MSWDEVEDYDDDYNDGYNDGPEGIDTTGVKMSKEEGLAHLRNYATKGEHGCYSYAFLMQEEDGTFTVVERNGMPCWGAMREYECGTRPDDPWPEDLRSNYHIFPKTGNPIAVAACFDITLAERMATESWKMYYPTIAQWETFINFVFNPEISPWRGALKDFELTRAKDGAYNGVVFKDTTIDPNIMVSLLRCNATQYALAKNFAQFMTDHPNVDPRVAYLTCDGIDTYNMAGRIVPDAWFNGTTVDISAGGTFFSRESYNRPDIAYIFGGKDNAGEIFMGKDYAYIAGLIPNTV
jgi:hypothetical protein